MSISPLPKRSAEPATTPRAASGAWPFYDDDEIAAVLRKMIPLSRAEPGCRLYMVNRSPEDPRKFLLYEQYVNEDGYKAHQATDAFKENILGKIVPMLEVRKLNYAFDRWDKEVGAQKIKRQ